MNQSPSAPRIIWGCTPGIQPLSFPRSDIGKSDIFPLSIFSTKSESRLKQVKWQYYPYCTVRPCALANIYPRCRFATFHWLCGILPWHSKSQFFFFTHTKPEFIPLIRSQFMTATWWGMFVGRTMLYDLHNEGSLRYFSNFPNIFNYCLLIQQLLKEVVIGDDSGKCLTTNGSRVYRVISRIRTWLETESFWRCFPP